MPHFHESILRAEEPYARSSAGATALPTDWHLTGAGPENGPQYEELLRQSFHFLRRHDSGRYSSTTKMRVINAAENAERARRYGDLMPGLPGVVAVTSPTRFDEDTEVKSGGLVGVAVVWPEENGRVVLAVHQQHRRERIGSLLVEALNYPCLTPALTAWVSQGNTVGQHFLLAKGFMPASMNSRGGVSYTRGGVQVDDGVEDGIDPLEPGLARLNVTMPAPSYYEDDEYAEDDPDF